MTQSQPVTMLRLLACSPALIALVVGAIVMRSSGPTHLAWCLGIAVLAADNGDYKTASICYARLLQAQPRDRETAFNLAQSLQAINQPEGARSLMNRLASEGDGYLPAHLWLARQVLMQLNPTDESKASAAAHLSRAMLIAPQDPDLNYWLAVLHARRGEWIAVEAPAAKTQGQLRSLSQMLVKIATGQGNVAAVARWSEK